MPGIDFRKALNDEQLAAVTGPDGPLLVLAAAGTGKTRTLVYRVAYLAEQGIEPDRILLLTFTNKAAHEMLERAHGLAGPQISGMWGGTFHHLANRLLRRHAPLLGYTHSYAILDRDDSETLMANCMKERKLGGKDFPKPAVILGIASSAANSKRAPERVAEERYEGLDVDLDDILVLLKAYTEGKRRIGAMDFDDLLVNCLRLLAEHERVRREHQERFRHVLVDEYQDTNPIQAEIVDLLAGLHRNLLVVGDDFQSIYGWRGADFRNIMSFAERYPDARTYKLETNYRSVPEILAVANACIAGNPEQFQKTLRPTRQPHRRPRIVHVRDGGEQARYIAEQVRLLRREGHKLSDMAILYRAHYHSMELQMVLTQERLSYFVTSGVRFFEQAHIKDVCSVLRLLENPKDELSFVRLLAMFPAVGPRTAEKIWGVLGGAFDASDGAQRAQLKQSLPARAVAVWDKVEPVLAGYREEGLHEDGGEVVYRFMKAFYERHLVDTFDDAPRRAEDIQELILYTAGFESVERFLSDVALLTNLDAEAEEKGAGREALRLSTVHQAKGLEWSVVFLVWVTEGMFPSGRALEESDDADAEERRLFYVAVTRAKDELFICVPEVRRNRDGGVQYCLPSRFVQELPPGLAEQVSPGFI